MKANAKCFCKIIAVSTMLITLVGCTSKKSEPQFSKLETIFELATTKSKFHLVERAENSAGKDPLSSLLKIGYKKYWVECDATVELGVDFSKVKVHTPDNNDTISIDIPNAEVIGKPIVDPESFSFPLTDIGFLTKLSDKDKKTTNDTAIKDLMKKFDDGTNQKLLNQAKTRAMFLVENYIINIGKQIGKSYHVEWNDVE
jgi:hypothetical protein